jgi:hypothetical protein
MGLSVDNVKSQGRIIPFGLLLVSQLLESRLASIHRPMSGAAGNQFAANSGAGLRDLMARMGHDSARAAMIYQHEARGADKAITDAIDAHLTDEQLGDDDGDDGASGVPSIGANGTTAIFGSLSNETPGSETASDLGFSCGAGDGNRTRMTSLEGWGSAIELRPRELAVAAGDRRPQQVVIGRVPAPRPIPHRGAPLDPREGACRVGLTRCHLSKKLPSVQ